MADTSRDATGSAANETLTAEASPLLGLLERAPMARSFADIEDPLEGCDALCRSITYGRVGDPAGTHTRERNQAVTMRAFGYLPPWPRDWMGSSEWVRPDGDEEGREVDEV